ncbi:MAG: methylated-DNA--[protein]-cysteine S-methyltransferase [Pedosphaera sp.]|nr:methylated-DNA--[protein]-cysteine S-methyltransferase [Pedosphaera sp.]
MIQLNIPTADGEFTAGYSANGLASLNFPVKRNGKAAPVGKAPPPQIRRWHRLTAAAVKQMLAGRAVKKLPPLDLSGGTDFQRAVWAAMRKIRCGRTRSYGEIARDIGNPKAVRAVGGACGANPIPVLVPCHRVLAANQKIGGFSSGLDWKRTLLSREGVALKD